MHTIQREMERAGNDVTDKISHHGYQRIYPWLLEAFRGRNIHLLEIGLDRLGSVDLWRRYFHGGLNLHGIDRDDKKSDDSGVTFHKVDQGKASELRAFAETVNCRFDIILDDGSHVPDHQLLSMEILWPLLAPGGVYIIEDIETSFWGKSGLYGYRFDARKASGNAIAQLMAAVEAVNSEFLPARRRRWLQRHRLAAVLSDVEMVTFGQNCVILVRKDPASFGRYYERKYRHAERVMAGHPLIRLWRGIREEGFWRIVRRRAAGLAGP